MSATRSKKAVQAAERRAAVREARQARREEIIWRWRKRRAGRMNIERTVSRFVDHVDWTHWDWRNDDEPVDSPDYVIASRVVARLARIIQLKEMPYSEYLQTPEWKERAAAAKKRYDGQCALDATHPADDAHHRTYERRGRELPTDLIPLCRACHETFHKKAPS